MLKKFAYLAAVCVTLAVTGSAGAQVGQGNVLIEEWYTANTGQQVGSDVTSLHTYIDSGKAPNRSYWATKLDRPDGGEDYWGGRMRGYIIPPETGDYTFWTASDDDSEVWLSTDDTPANATMICNVEGWMNYQDWTYTSGSPGTTYKSAPIPLEAGKRYYVDVFFSDGTGGGFDTVAWGGPGIGAGPVVVDGKYLAAFIRDPEPLFKAQNPDPANGATEITSPLFQWTAGVGAVMHEVYFGTSPDLGAADDRGPAPVAMYFHIPGLTPGTTYYWRVDETDAAGVTTQGDVWSFTAMPLTAHAPTPADQATDVKVAGSLQWVAGQSVTGHTVYLGTDRALVEAGDPSVQVAAGPEVKYDYAGLVPFTTYYWRVDEIGSAGEVIPGPVWSFSTVTYLSLTDTAVTLNYDNSADPFTSQVELTGAADWTGYGLSDLVIQFTGKAGPQGGLTYDESNQTYTLTGSGTDIWNNGDQFHYAYKTLNGDGTMVAQVTNIGAGTNTWAKGGVMIRQSLAAGSTHAYMPITANSDGTAGNGASFQRRLTANGSSSNSDSPSKVAPPYWVKIERVGNAFSGYISPDGQTWTQLGTAQTIAMTDPVYIGLAVTSHDAATMRTFTFANVSTTGNVTPDGPFSAWDDIGIASNDPQPLYAAVEDAAGKMAVVDFGDPAATQITDSSTWEIPLTAFAGVDLTNVAKLYVGAGDLLNPAPGGSGAVTLNSVRVVRSVAPVSAPTIIWVSDAYDDKPDGVPDDQGWVDFLRARGFNVDYQMGPALGDGYWRTLDDAKIAALNAADLVIVSRNLNSGDYNNGNERDQWNGLTVPLISMAMHPLRSSHWKWFNTTTINTAVPLMQPADPANPIFAGATLDANGLIEALGPTLGSSFPGVTDAGNGTVLATRADTGEVWIAMWTAGTEFYAGSGQIAAGPRVFFAGAMQETVPTIGRGEFNLTDSGKAVFLNVVDTLLP
jgi:hypothetical protein